MRPGSWPRIQVCMAVSTPPGQPAETDGSPSMPQKHGLAFSVVSDAGTG